MLLLSWCTLRITFSNYKVPWFLIAYFNLSLATHIPDENFFFLSGNFGAPLKKQQYCSFHGAPCIYHFQCRKCLESTCWFSFDTSYPNSTCKTFIFAKFQVFCQRSNDIDMVPWKMAWILVDFDLSLLPRIPYVKHINCENSRSAAKEASILLRSWNNLSIISSKW